MRFISRQMLCNAKESNSKIKIGGKRNIADIGSHVEKHFDIGFKSCKYKF